MKRVLGLILVGVGVALICLAPLLRFYVAPAGAVAPLNQYTESHGVGTVTKKLNITKFLAGSKDPYDTNIPITNTRYTRGDVLAAEQDPAKSDDLAIYDTFSRTDKADTNEMLTASTARYAFGRTNSNLSNCCGANSNGKTVDFSGIVPLKFPFFLGQQTYNIWDDTLQAAFPNTFVATEDHYGVNTYKFNASIPPTKAPGTELKIPAKIAGLPGAGNITLNQYYANEVTTWVEPTTGQIVDSSTTSLITYRDAAGVKDIVTVVAATAGGDPAYVKSAAPDIASKASLLNMFMVTGPIVSLILGLILAIGGFLLAKAGAREKADAAAAGPDPLLPDEPAPPATA